MKYSATNPDFKTRANASFNAQGLMQTFGAALEEITPGRAIVSAPISPAVSQHTGIAHAGLTFSIGDTAGGYAAMTLMPETQTVLTIEMKINLLAPAIGDKLFAEAVVLRAGRKIMPVEINVFAESSGNRTHVAAMLGTMVTSQIR